MSYFKFKVEKNKSFINNMYLVKDLYYMTEFEFKNKHFYISDFEYRITFDLLMGNKELKNYIKNCK